jgi:CRISPR-associated DxTHG motif protein
MEPLSANPVARKIVITVLGKVEDYQLSKHFDQENKLICQTRFAAEYLVDKYAPDYMFLVYLDFEKEQTWDAAVQLVDVLNGKSVHYSEMALSVRKSSTAPNNYDWDHLLYEIIDKINRGIKEFNKDDEIYIDITHGFRTMPYMLMGVFRYLSIVRGIHNIKITYGNKIEAGDVGDFHPHVYFAEILAFDDLNRWIDAASAFVRYGFSQDLCREIKAIRVDKMSKSLENLASRLRKITQTLHLVQWVDYVSAFKALNDSIQKILTSENFSELPPFVIYVIEWLRTELEPMFQYDDYDNINHHEQIQIQVLRWYRDSEMYTHALLLARELLITKALIVGVKCEKHEGQWSGANFFSRGMTNLSIVKFSNVIKDNGGDEYLMNDFIRQSNPSRYVRLNNDYGHAYQYDLKPDNLYPQKFTSNYLKVDIAFGKLVFDMRNDVGHGMGDNEILKPELILEVVDAIVRNDKCAQPVHLSLS